MTTWGAVHAGDTVRGADGAEWAVARVQHATAPWLISGKTDVTALLRRGDREIRARRTTTDPADVARRADHSDLAGAWAALSAAGFDLALLEENLSTTTADPFSAPGAPGAAPDGIKRDRWGRYMLPDPATGQERSWTRVTTVARALADEYHLTRWKLRTAAKGLAARPDLIAGAAAADPEADKKTLDEIADKAMEAAGSSAGATLGTALHNFTARLDRGETLAGVPAPLDADLAEYTAALKRHQLRIESGLIERIVVLPEFGIAGTFDRIVRQPAGETKAAPLAVMDLKTGKDITFALLEIAVQLALYSRATHMWNTATRAYEPLPADVDRDRGLVLHLPVGKAHAQLYAVNLIEGWEFAQLAVKVREARSAGKGLGWLVEPEPEDLALHRVRKAADQAALAALWDQLHPKGLWTPEINAAAAQRWDEINNTAA